MDSSDPEIDSHGGSDYCYLALGSNVGDRLRHLSLALRRLAGLEGIQVVKASSLYSTAAQYVVDQPAFLNAVVKLKLSSARVAKLGSFLADLKALEEELGRRPGIRRGPRVIDLDIIAVGERQISIKDGPHPLEVPHLNMHERDFVLVPMAELCPDWRHPTKPGHPRVRDMLEGLCTGSDVPAGASLDSWPTQVIPGAGGISGRETGLLWRRGEKTLIMGILNITPDSFSDGGDNLKVEDALSSARSMLEAGADILDIGGESTRPGAAEVSADDQVKRVVPVIRAIREAGLDATISIDTRKAEVARAAIEAGADWINDVSGGSHDAGMLTLAAEKMTPIVLMHMKGTPDTMNSLAAYDSVVDEVGQHLLRQRDVAEAAGVPRWNIVLDPGIGFAKTADHNLILFRRCGELVERLRPSPVLVGASRKRFIGTILDEPDAKKRMFGNAATTAATVFAGADLVRVHEVKEMAQTARVCDHIYRFSQKDAAS